RSRTGVRGLIAEGKALRNRERRQASPRGRAGDRVVVEVVRENAGTLSEAEVSILFEDDWMLALDKASGVVVHPVGPHQEGTLLQALHRRSHGGVLPTLIHRIDQYTSGVLLVAKSDSVRAEFSDMLERGEVDKEYDALLLGRMEDDAIEIESRIGAVGDSRILMQVDSAGGRPAKTRVEVVERFRHATWARIEIFTGRTHQIRVHCASVGHPLLGDHLYGDGLPVFEPSFLERFALHARRVSFRHPRTGEPQVVEAPLPDPFSSSIDCLRSG
ncbi:MAG: RluA family pseudouridine synthase, partial [Planctomycetota bacterium]|nr:RluA family pseudouridine synthase [Planctomycetota bacterium]